MRSETRSKVRFEFGRKIKIVNLSNKGLKQHVQQ